MKEKKVFFGMKLYRSERNGIREFTVDKVGKKYFYTKEIPRDRITIDTLTYETEYSQSKYTLHLTAQEILDRQEVVILYDKIKSAFMGWNNNNKFTLQELRDIAKIAIK